MKHSRFLDKQAWGYIYSLDFIFYFLSMNKRINVDDSPSVTLLFHPVPNHKK